MNYNKKYTDEKIITMVQDYINDPDYRIETISEKYNVPMGTLGNLFIYRLKFIDKELFKQYLITANIKGTNTKLRKKSLEELVY